jgi:cellulose synthase/poly-beta-1,6-N-acetylglucosamine synthase-like glycosyltransferase
MQCVPRPSPKFLGNRHRLRTPWNFQLSVFKHFKKDDERLLNDCFELDWSRTKVERLIKDDAERARVKQILKANYKWFRESYKFISGLDPQKDLFCISNVVYSDQVQ